MQLPVRRGAASERIGPPTALGAGPLTGQRIAQRRAVAKPRPSIPICIGPQGTGKRRGDSARRWHWAGRCDGVAWPLFGVGMPLSHMPTLSRGHGTRRTGKQTTGGTRPPMVSTVRESVLGEVD